MKDSHDMNECALIATLKLFSSKWKPCILSQLLVEEKRYSQLKKIIPNISKKMLTEHLRELEKDGLIHREVFPSVPPQVTYSLTEKGQSLQPIFLAISNWGISNLENVTSMEVMLNSEF